MKHKITECGHTKGQFRVQAITDDAGTQVIVTDDQSPYAAPLVSKPLNNHTEAIALGKRIVKHNIHIYDEWNSPVGLFETWIYKMHTIKNLNEKKQSISEISLMNECGINTSQVPTQRI